MRCDCAKARREARIEAIKEVLALPGGKFIAVADIRALLHPTVTYEVTAVWRTTDPDYPEPELGSPT